MSIRIQTALGIAVTTGLMLANVGAHAQQGTGQAQTPPTEGRLTDPAPNLPRGAAVPPNWLTDDQFMRWPYPPADRAYNDLDGFRIKGHINEITAISRKSRDDGNQYWGRITGTPYDTMTTDWVVAQFRRIGLEQVRIQEFDLPAQWFPTSWDVAATGAGKTVQMKSAFPLFNSVATKGSVELEPVWIGMGTAADFAGRSVTGKAVVLYGFPNPGGRGNTALTLGAVRRADAAGAAAVLLVLGFPGNVTNEPQAGGTAAPAKVPVFMIGDDDGTALREMIEANESPKLRLRLAVETRTGLKTASVWGVLPGATDENVAVMAHTDAFFEGAMDNASGIATMVALAEHFAKVPKAQRRRTMTFFTTSAHHSPSGENAGITVDSQQHEGDVLPDRADRELRAYGAGRDVSGRRSVHHVQPGERAAVVRWRQRAAEEHRAQDLQGLRGRAVLTSRRAPGR